MTEELPLAGIHVLDAATYIAAPVAAGILGEFGAEVLKIEKPGVGDPLRKFGSPSGRPDGTLNWMNDARNRRSITLDLRKPKGAELFKRLVADADVVIENFRPGTMEKWGLGWDVLHAVNRRMVMLRLTAYGQTGPMRDRVGFARMAHAMGGIGYLAGNPGEPPVNPGPASLADYITAVYGALGVLLALRARDRGGIGQYIDLALYEAVFRSLDETLPAYAKHGKIRQPTGSLTSNAAPNANYPTKDGKYASISCTDDKMFGRIVTAMGRPELIDDPRWATNAARLKIRPEVEKLVSDWTKTLARDELVRICDANEVPCGAILSIEDIYKDPHYQAREMFTRIMDPEAGEVVLPAPVPKLSRTPGRVTSVGPKLGDANDDIYRGQLGLSDADIAALKKDGVI